MRGVALLVALFWLLELPRDLHFLQGAEWRLVVGMSIKISTGLLAWVGLGARRPVASAFLVVWCLQGALMSAGEWLGQGANLLSLASLMVRSGLIYWWLRGQRKGGTA